MRTYTHLHAFNARNVTETRDQFRQSCPDFARFFHLLRLHQLQILTSTSTLPSRGKDFNTEITNNEDIRHKEKLACKSVKFDVILSSRDDDDSRLFLEMWLTATDRRSSDRTVRTVKKVMR